MDGRDRYVLQTIGRAALFAVEMYVLVGDAVVVAGAYFIFQGAAAVIDDVHRILLCEKFEYPEDACLVYGAERCFQVGKADG